MSEDYPAYPAGFRAGSLLAGYWLEAEAGAGGMAVVFRARDERLRRLVALKVLAPAYASDSEFRQRFIHESRAAAAVDDPHIIPIYEAGEADGILFIAMRFVRGGDLRDVLQREGALSPARAAEFISPVASALDAAHAAELVHRDVKPGNILVDARPGRPDHVYLSDFGISKGGATSVGLTQAGHFVGTVDYSAPEQIQGLTVDGHADQYSLACVTYQLLTGTVPFERDTYMAVMMAQVHEPPPSLRARRPDLPGVADDVLAKAMAKRPEQRYASCTDFADALREAFGLPPYHARGSAAGSSAASAYPPPPAISPSGVSSPAAAAPGTAVALPAQEPPPADQVAVPAGPGREAGDDAEAHPPTIMAVAADAAPDTQDVAVADLGIDRELDDSSGGDGAPADGQPRNATAASPASPIAPSEAFPPTATAAAIPAPPDSAPAPAEPVPTMTILSVPGTGSGAAPEATSVAEAVPDEDVPGTVPDAPETMAHAPDTTVDAPDAAPADQDAPPDPGVAQHEPGPEADDIVHLSTAASEIPLSSGATMTAVAPPDPAVAAVSDAAPGGEQADVAELPAEDLVTETDSAGREAGDDMSPAPAVTAMAMADEGMPAATAAVTVEADTWPAASLGTADTRPAASLGTADTRPAASLGTADTQPAASLGTAAGAGRPGRPSPAPDTTADAPDVPEADQRAPAGAGTARRRRRRLPALALAGVVLGAAGVIPFMLTKAGNSPSLGRSVNAAKSAGPSSSLSPSASVGPANPPRYSRAGIDLPSAYSGSGGLISSLAFSPSGGTLAIADTAGICLWDIPTRDCTSGLASAWSVAFSPDGKILAAGNANSLSPGASNENIDLWDVAAKRQTAPLANPDSQGAYAVAFSHDGRTLAAGDANGSVYLWNVAARSKITSLADPHSQGVNAVAFSPDGRTLAAGDASGGVYLWNIATGKLIALTGPHGRAADSVAFSRDGKSLAAGDANGSVYRWNLATRSEIAPLTDPRSRGVNSVVFSPDGKILAAGAANGSTYVWNVATGKRTATLTDPGSGGINAVTFSPDGKTLATGDEHGGVSLWHEA